MMKAKLIQNVLPPIIYRLLLRIYLFARGHGWYIFYGCYPTLADVPTSDSQNSAWYVAASLEQSDRPRHPILGDDAGLLILPLEVAQLLHGSQDIVTVLDFGGGFANGMNKILAHLPDPDLARLRYVLVETPAMCQAVRERFAAQLKEAGSIIEVTEAIPAVLPHPLIVHARSSIQYIADYHALLSRLLALAPEIFIIAHTSFSDAPTYAQQQLNNLHRKLARWVFNREQLIAEIEKAGYRLSLTFDHELPIAYKKAPAPSSDASMVFHRLPNSPLPSAGSTSHRVARGSHSPEAGEPQACCL